MPDPSVPDPSLPGPFQPGPARSGPARSGPARSGPARPDPARPEPARPDPARERIALYDADGRVVGEADRGEVYARSLWHGTSATLLRSTDGARVYVHRRTDDKLVMAGLHDCWAGGVIDAGESPDDAAARELAEELGITDVALEHLFTLAWDASAEGADTGPGTGPYGLRAHVFAYQAFSDGPVVHQPSEIAEGGWMEIDELRRRLDDPTWPFVPDGRTAALRWLSTL